MENVWMHNISPSPLLLVFFSFEEEKEERYRKAIGLTADFLFDIICDIFNGNVM